MHAISKITPTVLLAAPGTVQSYLSHPSTTLPSGIAKYMNNRTLQAGNLPSKSTPTTNSGGEGASPLSHLRLLLIPQSTTSKSNLSSSILHTLRLYLKSRVGYALTTPSVAGAVAQTNILDYRDKGSKSCVGAPLSSVEVHLAGDEEGMGKSTPRGTVCLLLLVRFVSFPCIRVRPCKS